MKGATPPEVQFFGEVCKRVGLDPFKRQIHAVQRWDAKEKRMVWTYQTGIDGYRAIANSTGAYAGSDEPRFMPEDESTPNPRKATVTVWKLVSGTRVPFTASARWEEYVQTTKEGSPNSMWRKMPYGQLSKCAEALALRKAFPERLSGIYTEDEMQQADSETDRGHDVKGRHPGFDLESKPFEEPKPQPAPKPAEKPAPPKPQVVEAEVVEEAPRLAVPAAIAAWTHGKWKEPMGALRGKALNEAREAAFAGGTPEQCAQACASIYDQAIATLAAKGRTEADLATAAVESGIEGVEFPADLWSKPQHYQTILNLAKA